MKELLNWAKIEYDKNPRRFAIFILGLLFILLGLTGDLEIPVFGKLTVLEPYRTISIIFGIISLFTGLLMKNREQTIEAEKIRKLKTYLSARFSANFIIIDEVNNKDDSLFYKTTSKIFIKEINNLIKNSDGAKEIVVGIVGGATIFHVCQCLLENPKIIKSNNYKQIFFVALNTAGLYNFYQFSANYLCVQLSEIFKGSSHFACTTSLSKYEQKVYTNYISRIDLILCSAGNKKSGFLSEWLCRRNPDFKMPDEVVGDFCLIPIDRTGNVVSGTGEFETELLKLNLKPVFENLSHFENRLSVILPIMENPKLPNPDQMFKKERTEKKEITLILLKSKIVKYCILNKEIAEALCND